MSVQNEKSRYNLRSKFKLQLERFSLSENFFDSCFDSAISMSSNMLKKKLWDMSFNESVDGVLKFFGLSVNEGGDGSKRINPELVLPLRNELRWQYTTNIDKNFLKPSFSLPCYEEAYTKFSKEFGTDQILKSGIITYLEIFLRLDDRSLTEKTIFLLKSKKENFIYGGLRNIGMKSYEANLFISKGEVIGNFISECYLLSEENGGSMMEDNVTSQVEATTASPFANLGHLLKDKGIELPEFCEEESTSTPNIPVSCEESFSTPNIPIQNPSESSQTEESVSQHTQELDKTPELPEDEKNLEVAPIPEVLDQIMGNAALVDDFINIYDEVVKAGLDVNYLISKRDAVKTLLDGYFGLLEEASKYLQK